MFKLSSLSVTQSQLCALQHQFHIILNKQGIIMASASAVHILVKTEREANAILQQLQKGNPLRNSPKNTPSVLQVRKVESWVNSDADKWSKHLMMWCLKSRS